jgi:type II secretory pathway pseudopilin PulG
MIRFPTNARAQSGFAYIAAIVLLVVVAGMATALLRLTGTQQSTVNQARLQDLPDDGGRDRSWPVQE